MEFKDVEEAHQKYKSKTIKIVWASVIIGFVSLIFSVAGGATSILDIISTAFIIGLFVAALFAILFFIFARNDSQAYRSAYKAYFVEKNLQKVFTNLKYNHESGLSSAVLAATRMVNTGDRYNSNDLTTGEYKDVAFTQADVHIEVEYTDSDGDTHYSTIFKGRFMLFEFPKKFNFRLEAVEKGFGANIVPRGRSQKGRKFEKIELESSEFNKIFKTYAEDGFEAFYLLDPAFINNMLTLAEQYKGKLLLGFTDNMLLVGLKDGKDAFEPPSVFKKLDEKTETEKISKDINLITNFVDTLKLNNKLFN